MQRGYKEIMQEYMSAMRHWNDLDCAVDSLIRAEAKLFGGVAFYHIASAIDDLRMRMDKAWEAAEECERELEALTNANASSKGTNP